MAETIPDSMLAGRLNVRTRDFAVTEVPVPTPGPGEVLVRVRAAGVCLSDVHLIEGELTPLFLPGDTVTLGHEVAGTVAALGAGVAGWATDQRVLLQAGEERRGVVHTRGVDYDGGWAQYAVARADTLVAVPDDLPLEQACIVPDAVSTPWGAITATAGVRPAQPVGVWGIGGLGAHGVQLLRLAGAAPIIAVDPVPAARERALQFGADVALDPAADDLVDQVRAATGGAGLAFAFDFAGVAAVREQAVRALGVGGALVLVGLTRQPLTIADGTAFSYFGQKVLGHYGSMPEHVLELVQLVRHHRIDFARSVSDTLPLSQAATAVDRLSRKEGDPIRLVLQP
ncbi:zinc-binding dehydrogenase [Modestobacter sp. VKM Ac-2985]|uniref:zinc-binding dehydrogenase n=1 Tax=Modestobacter sp. VKM Ac-2985 TaxID=3004139 RepID=UPI0022AB61ED|nr:zinc-binding dehydrogenase [Modestobacter sp. VKM Ac-2985]MCZ2838110.1 zinc-binding dehydrogenase [Modestobacter sp. VKM Ac-2985]